MRLCPKCRIFFDDELLKFCLKDGSPLVKIDQTNQLWSHGINQIRVEKKIIQRETRIQLLKKILSWLVTMILIILVITVITLWGWIYVNKQKPEITDNNNPKSTPEVSSTEMPEILVAGLETPTPTPTAQPTPTVTVSPTVSPTVKISPTITATPFVCNEAEKQKEETQLRNSKLGEFSKDILNNHSQKAKLFFKQQHQVFQMREFDVYSKINTFEVVVVDCKNAKISLNGEFNPTIKLDISVRPYPFSMNYDCDKRGNNWNCALR